MDVEDRYANQLFTAVAQSCERLTAFRIELRRRPEIVEVIQGTELRNLESGPTFETYSDAKLICRKGVTWWLEIYWDENQWSIESRVSVSNLEEDEGSIDLFEFQDRIARTVPEFIALLEEATSELIRSETLIDFSTGERIIPLQDSGMTSRN